MKQYLDAYEMKSFAMKMCGVFRKILYNVPLNCYNKSKVINRYTYIRGIRTLELLSFNTSIKTSMITLCNKMMNSSIHLKLRDMIINHGNNFALQTESFVELNAGSIQYQIVSISCFLRI